MQIQIIKLINSNENYSNKVWENQIKSKQTKPKPSNLISENLECQSPISQDKLTVVKCMHYDKNVVFEDSTVEINIDLQTVFSW